ncbi:hypothetical protein HYC85_014209 [Camellia sinensis]|uniref:Uncharacterized protein n=1 Tax=Camellia sinensis TaxID=4442 RepID=A0A7J7H5K0_CAMSI|nr:hypothetical protein HYC85_014209 [Camellia sinensis]
MATFTDISRLHTWQHKKQRLTIIEKSRDSVKFRRDNPEIYIYIEKNRVPKMTSHYDSLATISGEERVGVNVGKKGKKEREKESHADKARRANRVAEKEAEAESKKEKKEDQRGGLSLEEISKYRQSAQQNSMDAIRAAEERYAKKAKELGSSALQNVKESAQQAKDYTAQTAHQANDYASQKAVGAKEAGASVAEREPAKDVVVETGKSTVGYGGKEEETGEQECGSGEVVEKPAETVQEEFYRAAPEEHERREHQGGGGIFAAIVETIVEIAQNTKDLVVGQDDQTRGYKGGSIEYTEPEEVEERRVP